MLVDLELDVALLYAPGVDAPALLFTTEEPGRGDQGATVGFPVAAKTVERATVAATYFATGLDVTGEARVTRRILELRARVIPGDSGGPFVLEDGTVGGVVFAESRVDPAVGYALSPKQVLDRVAPALGERRRPLPGPASTDLVAASIAPMTTPGATLRSLADPFWDGYLAATHLGHGHRRSALRRRLEDVSPSAIQSRLEWLDDVPAPPPPSPRRHLASSG